MKVLHQATAQSIVSLTHAAAPRFYNYYPVSGQNSLPMWLAIIVTFLNDKSNSFKKITLSHFVMGNVGCVVYFRNSIPRPLPGAATGQVQRSDSFMNKSSLRHHMQGLYYLLWNLAAPSESLCLIY
jgi:hypothetical protein